MVRKYFKINENNARVSHEMMSFSDYKPNSTTGEYCRLCDRAYDLAEEAAERRPAEAERLQRLAERYAEKMAEYFNREASIGMMCPSILISGSGNFPTKRKQRQVAAWERNHHFFNEVQKILDKINSIRTGAEIIKSDDERAIEKLTEKLEDLRQLQERMKAANKAIRLKDTEAGDDHLREMGYTESEIKALRMPDFLGRVGFADYALTNNNANIHRVEQRLNSIRAAKDAGTTEEEREGYKIVKNTEIMRYQIIFDDKPAAEVRDLLKGNGFKWAPSQGAWQRQITANGEWALRRVRDKLDELMA